MMCSQSLRGGSVKPNGKTIISTINGYYDVDGYDTPSLHISNTTAFNFTNVKITLTAYQGINNGLSQTATIGTIGAGSTYIDVWGGSTSPGNLFAYDYDDEYNGTFSPATGYGLGPNGTLVLAPQCAPQSNIYGWNYCADTGNFLVTITAMWNGIPIYSQFSPANNATGKFVAWEGLDPNGWSETTYDSHSSGGPNGVLANIYEGTPPPPTPEPGSLMLFGTGLVAAIGYARRKWIN